VADVFDALTSDRPYRQAMSAAEATEFITHQSGQQFDPAVVTAFRARTDALVAILKQQRAQQPSKVLPSLVEGAPNVPPPPGEGVSNAPPPLGESRVGADRILKEAS
jgi:putative two-component system response regulator